MSSTNDRLIGDLAKDVSQISTDSNLPEATRGKIVDLWTNYLELKSYVDEPRGSYLSYREKYSELADNRDRLAESVKLLLGVTVD